MEDGQEPGNPSEAPIPRNNERHEEQRRLEQRAQLIPFWEYTSSLREIDPRNPITPQVVNDQHSGVSGGV
jgi:hypothetical protein